MCDVYRQLTPKQEGVEWIAQLKHVGVVIDAPSGEAAIDAAKAARMAKYPIVAKAAPIVAPAATA